MSVFSFTEAREIRKFIAVGAILLALISVLTYYFFNSSGNILLKRNGLEALPSHTIAAIQFRNDAASRQIFLKNSFFQNLLGDTALPGLQWIERLFSMENTAAEGLENARITLSAHQARASQPDFLLIAELSNPSDWTPLEQSFQSILSSKNTLTERRFENGFIYELNFQALQKTLTFSLQNNLLIASISPFLVEDAIRQLKSGKTAIPASLMAQGEWRNTHALSVLLNYKFLPDGFQSILNNTCKGGLDFIKNCKGWSKLDLIMKNDAVCLNGITTLGDSVANFLNTIQSQQAVEMHCAEVLPNRTAAYLSIGISDYASFMKANKQFMSSNNSIIPFLSQNMLAKERYKIDLEPTIKSWDISELSLALTESSGDSIRDNLLAIVRCDNPEKAVQLFQQLAAIDSLNFPKTKFNQRYHNRSIQFINLPGILYSIGGSLFKDFQRPFCVNIDNYLIFSNKLPELKKYIDDAAALELLDRQEAFQNLMSYSNANGNLMAFANTPRNLQLIRACTMLDSTAIAHNHPIDLKNLYGFFFQLSNNNQRLFSNLTATYFKAENNGPSLLWALNIDTTVSGKPQVVINHNNNEKEIALQDELNQLYLINNTGKVIWKRTIQGKIISDIQQVDYYRNGKLQLLFNTATHLHLIDRLGNYVPGYPKRLSTTATAGLAVFDYENDKNYRIFVPCNNGAVYGYQLSGAPLEGWSPRSGLGISNQPLFFARIKGKDYLAVGNTEGTVRFLNRRGELLQEIKIKDKKVFKNPYTAYIDEQSQTYQLINTDAEGLIYRYSSDGSLTTRTTSVVSPEHVFGFEDISGDKEREYVFLDKDQLFVYQQKDTALVYNYLFNEPVTSSPQYIRSDSSANNMVAIVSIAENKVFAFTDKGIPARGFPLKGNTSFTIDDLRKDGKKCLIVGGKNHQVYVYELN